MIAPVRVTSLKKIRKYFLRKNQWFWFVISEAPDALFVDAA